ncbi:hypothetical protein C1645_831961 [Glomus cerebriforme]|uniref:F-box domain-containing protein n=1 Tax=Glomus cerebriforme TaxID=658196 RepID=A0A397SGG8_9GLOM|nr:hypothetical protein C1645_831961 [Glomus cerebriforme]
MTKTLPPEVVRSLVLYLKDDKKFLHSCLFVSRDWCREAVYLLWKQSFHFLYTCNKTNLSVSSQSTNLDLELTNDCNCSKEKRQSQAANLLMTYFSIKYYDELIKEGIIDTKSRNTLFNYLKFLNVLSLHELYVAIKDWIHWDKFDNKIQLLNFLNSKFNLNSIDILDKYTPLIFSSIFRYFFAYSSELELLSFDTKFILHKINNNNPCSFLKYHKILMNEFNELNFPETKQCFVNLTELVLTTDERKNEIFSLLSRTCHNIQKMSVRVNFHFFSGCGFAIRRENDVALEEAKQLTSLIRSQHNLIYFELFGTYQVGMSEILKSLKETQHDSLKTLIFNSVTVDHISYFLFQLEDFQNLQDLRFIKCIYYEEMDGIDERRNNYGEDLWLPNLKFLQVDCLDDYQDDFDKLSFILLRCSPLINEID